MTSNLWIRQVQIESQQNPSVDILIEQGCIKAIGISIYDKTWNYPVIDADGLLLFPGGIDPHVHLHLDLGNNHYGADDFIEGSAAALADGTTCFLDFITPAPDESLQTALQKRLNEAQPSLCDYGLHFSITEKKQIAEISQIIQKGCPSGKIYTAYKNTIGINDDLIFLTMEEIIRHQGLLLAHCENGEIIEVLREKLFTAGFTSPKYHPQSRPNICEADAIAKMINMSRLNGCPVYIVHVSAKESLELIHKARSEGIKIFGETCPQYLLLDDNCYDKPDFTAAAAFVLSPPLRQKADVKQMWQALQTQTIQSIATDHCPHTNESRQRGKHDFRLIPNGIAGIGQRMSLLYHFGLNNGLISPAEFVNLTSTNAAKLFGLYPKKGHIFPGADADLVLFDPSAKQTISAKNHYHNNDSCVFEGFELTGKPVVTIQRGRIVYQNGQVIAQVGSGLFQKRKPFTFVANC